MEDIHQVIDTVHSVPLCVTCTARACGSTRIVSKETSRRRRNGSLTGDGHRVRIADAPP